MPDDRIRALMVSLVYERVRQRIEQGEKLRAQLERMKAATPPAPTTQETRDQSDVILDAAVKLSAHTGSSVKGAVRTITRMKARKGEPHV